MPSDEDFKKAMAHLSKAAATKGIGSLRVDDGQIFMFSRSFVQQMMDTMDVDDKDEMLVFVAQGPTVKDITETSN